MKYRSRATPRQLHSVHPRPRSETFTVYSLSRYGRNKICSCNSLHLMPLDVNARNMHRRSDRITLRSSDCITSRCSNIVVNAKKMQLLTIIRHTALQLQSTFFILPIFVFSCKSLLREITKMCGAISVRFYTRDSQREIAAIARSIVRM